MVEAYRNLKSRSLQAYSELSHRRLFKNRIVNDEVYKVGLALHGHKCPAMPLGLRAGGSRHASPGCESMHRMGS